EDAYTTSDRARPLVPADDGVLTRGHVLDHIVASRVRRGEEDVRKDEHDRAHIGVDVAEHLDDASLGKRHALGAAIRVSAEIEAADTRQREDVVIHVIAIWEFDCGSL